MVNLKISAICAVHHRPFEYAVPLFWKAFIQWNSWSRTVYDKGKWCPPNPSHVKGHHLALLFSENYFLLIATEPHGFFFINIKLSPTFLALWDVIFFIVGLCVTGFLMVCKKEMGVKCFSKMNYGVKLFFSERTIKK
jgi:hypothetical protein